MILGTPSLLNLLRSQLEDIRMESVLCTDMWAEFAKRFYCPSLIRISVPHVGSIPTHLLSTSYPNCKDNRVLLRCFLSIQREGQCDGYVSTCSYNREFSAGILFRTRLQPWGFFYFSVSLFFPLHFFFLLSQPLSLTRNTSTWFNSGQDDHLSFR